MSKKIKKILTVTNTKIENRIQKLNRETDKEQKEFLIIIREFINHANQILPEIKKPKTTYIIERKECGNSCQWWNFWESCNGNGKVKGFLLKWTCTCDHFPITNKTRRIKMYYDIDCDETYSSREIERKNKLKHCKYFKQNENEY